MAPKAAVADKKKAAVATTKKKKDKVSSSKDKDRTKSTSKSGAKKSSSKSKSATPAPAPPATGKTDEVLLATSTLTLHDPDAVQLFRRYDRARAGVLTRLDFLQLLRDYASPPGADASGESSSSRLQGAEILHTQRAALQRARKPLSLTDTSGIPLGYERSDKNSEFEAGQLFERYDKDRTGALTLDKFHSFFADFKPQLTAFVEDLNYNLIPHSGLPAATAHSESPSRVAVLEPQDAAEAAPSGADRLPASEINAKSETERKKRLKSNYQAALWKLRKLYKEELVGQRERILEMMSSIRETISSHQRKVQAMLPPRWQQQQHGPFENRDRTTLPTRWIGQEESENQVIDLYEAMEEDLERIDDIGSCVRRYLKRGGGVSSEEMEKFLTNASDLQEQAQYLAMKDYTVSDRMSKLSGNDISNRQQHNARMQPQLTPTQRSNSKETEAGAHEQHSADENRSRAELSQLLRVKDQMIYQLLLERTEMRKQKASMESYLQELSDVSTAEMKKWARLTDEMQAEIEQLRIQARRGKSSR
ncbi:hypothetical protein Gpo141_00004478 [Globisporangium polare]